MQNDEQLEQIGTKICDLVPHTDNILKTKTERFDFRDPPIDPIELSHMLAQTMLYHNGLGLAAPQIGLPYRAFAIVGDPIIVMFNPKIVDVSEDTLLLEEGCLSYPNLYVKIKRPQVIRVRYTEPNGQVETKQFQDITARVIQHELDHLDGIVHTQRASYIHLQQARSEKKKLDRQMKKAVKLANENR